MDNKTLTSQELRIGNLLQYFTQSVFVIGIKKDTVELGYYSDSIGFERFIENSDLNPIELSPELLIRLGFKKMKDPNDKGTIYQNRKVAIKLRGGEFSFFLSDTEDDWYYTTSITIQYCHQLQNLYFALCGSELVLKQ